MQHFIMISTCINDQILPPPKKKSCKYFNYSLHYTNVYKKGETTQGEYVTGPKPPGVQIP